jgi:hypothetical protein
MRKFQFALLILSALAGVSQAQPVDPDDDGIGIYFDPCACNNCVTMDVGMHRGFLVITHPTSPAGVRGWEAKVWADGPIDITGVVMQGSFINVGTPPEYMVGTAEPLINPFTYPAVVVATVNFFLSSAATPSRFFIDGVFFHSLPEKVPAYLDGADYSIIKKLQQSTGGPTIPVALINGTCDDVVAAEVETWGDVKALFR